MLTVIAGIVMLGILVFIHELGHFCIAKISGVKVLKFSLGFGPRLISRKWRETEYMICAIPLGGYVQMLGEGGGENGEEAELTPEERRRSFAEQPVSRRTAIIAAGPFMNLVFPFLILPIAFLVGVQIPAFLEQPPCVGYVLGDSVGQKASFQAGDCIFAINGEKVATWNEANKALISHAGSQLNFTVSRAGQSVNVPVAAEENSLEGLQSFGLLPPQTPVIGSLAPSMPAQSAGIEIDDRITAIDGQPIASWYELKQAIQSSAGRPQLFTVMRGDKELQLKIEPIRQVDNGTDYLVGIAPKQETIFKRFGPLEAIRAGYERSMELIELTLVFIQKMFAGHVSTSNIGGPITVVQIAGQAAQTDLASILSVLAFLSIQLGILNLFPIPILDGGHLLFNLFELVFRRPLSLRTREIAQQVGLTLLLLLMVLAFYNDIMRLFYRRPMNNSELLLTIDTSTMTVGIAVSRGETLLGEIALKIQGSRTDQLLLQSLEQLLADLELRPELFSAFAAVIGPGSFTGLRVGIATIKGLAIATGRPVLGVSSLRALALQAAFSQGPVCALLDARKKEVYAALYDCNNAFPALLGEEMVMTPERLAERLSGPVLLIGNGADLYRRLFEERLGSDARFLPWSCQLPRAGHAAALALADFREGKGTSPAFLFPHYIRRSEAELLYDGRVENSLIEG